MLGPEGPHVTVEGFDGPLDLLLELVEEKKLDILTVRLGELADAYLARIRALDALPAEEVSAFLALASRLVLLKARSLLPSLLPLAETDEGESEEDLRARLLELRAGHRLHRARGAHGHEGGRLHAAVRCGEPARASRPRGGQHREREHAPREYSRRLPRIC